MDVVTREVLGQLVEANGPTCVSIYLPTWRVGAETQENPIRLNYMLREVDDQLRQRDVPRAVANRILDPAQSWLRDEEFWRSPGEGLAIFLTPERHWRFRLPHSFEERIEIGDSLSLSQLLPAIQLNGQFYLLAISQNTCRLFSGDRDVFQEVAVPQLPKDMDSALGWWWEKQENWHTMHQPPQSRGGADVAVHHGHEADITHDALVAYLRKVDTAVTNAISDHRVPLVFASVEYLFPIYKEISEYPRLCSDIVAGNPDYESPRDLHRRAWELVRPLYETDVSGLLDEYHRLNSQSKATDDLGTILRAARDGLVRLLILAEGSRQWGQFDPATGHTEVNEQRGDASRDLLDQAVLLTLRSSGEVRCIDGNILPGEVHAIALLRAPVQSVATPMPRA